MLLLFRLPLPATKCAINLDRNLKPKLAIMHQCTSVTYRRTDRHWHRSISEIALKKQSIVKYRHYQWTASPSSKQLQTSPAEIRPCVHLQHASRWLQQGTCAISRCLQHGLPVISFTLHLTLVTTMRLCLSRLSVLLYLLDVIFSTHQHVIQMCSK